MVTTEFVLLELCNALPRGVNRDVFTRLLTLLRADPYVQLIPASTDLFDRAAALYAARSDKEWSLVDCASFVTMSDLRIKHALTTDHHFEQAGFKVLLK